MSSRTPVFSTEGASPPPSNPPSTPTNSRSPRIFVPLRNISNIYFESVVARALYTAQDSEDHMSTLARKITLVLDESVLHEEIGAHHVSAMLTILPKIQNRSDYINTRAERALNLWTERNDHHRDLCKAQREEETLFRNVRIELLRELVEIVEESLCAMDAAMDRELRAAQLATMWRERCDVDFCWAVLKHKAVMAEMKMLRVMARESFANGDGLLERPLLAQMAFGEE